MAAVHHPSTTPTSPQDSLSTGDHYANYVPHDLKYSPTFEDELLALVLHGPGLNNPKPGIRLIPLDSTEEPGIGISIRTSDISLASLPIITEAELPLPINDPRRIFSSPIPGLKLTHPNGYLEGGPGLDHNLDTFTDDFLSNHNTTPNNDTATTLLRAAITAEIQSSISHLKQRLKDREEAKKKNEEVEKKLRELRQEHDMELRVHNKMAEDVRRRKDAKAEMSRTGRRQGGGRGG